MKLCHDFKFQTYPANHPKTYNFPLLIYKKRVQKVQKPEDLLGIIGNTAYRQEMDAENERQAIEIIAKC